MAKTGLLLSQINHGIYLKDKSNELSVLVDRAVGGSSIVDGQLELILHRFNPFFLLFLSCFYTGISKNMKQLKGKMPVLCCFGPLRFPSGSVKFELYGSYTWNNIVFQLWYTLNNAISVSFFRRLLYDDGRGVAEALNETVCIGDKCQGLTVRS